VHASEEVGGPVAEARGKCLGEFLLVTTTLVESGDVEPSVEGNKTVGTEEALRTLNFKLSSAKGLGAGRKREIV
jgi:hypothetical protein